jgi:hypothetical protein
MDQRLRRRDGGFNWTHLGMHVPHEAIGEMNHVPFTQRKCSDRVVNVESVGCLHHMHDGSSRGLGRRAIGHPPLFHIGGCQARSVGVLPQIGTDHGHIVLCHERRGGQKTSEEEEAA